MKTFLNIFLIMTNFSVLGTEYYEDCSKLSYYNKKKCQKKVSEYNQKVTTNFRKALAKCKSFNAIINKNQDRNSLVIFNIKGQVSGRCNFSTSSKILMKKNKISEVSQICSLPINQMATFIDPRKRKEARKLEQKYCNK